jgi:hypothetical protein
VIYSYLTEIPKNIISPIYFNLNCAENGVDNSSSEAQPHSETSRGSYLDLKLLIFAKIFEFYLVTQSL